MRGSVAVAVARPARDGLGGVASAALDAASLGNVWVLVLSGLVCVPFAALVRIVDYQRLTVRERTAPAYGRPPGTIIDAMGVRTALLVVAAIGALVVAAPAGAVLELTPQGASLFQVTGEGEGDRERALLARQGDRYRFQVDYEVAGADEIGTAHSFIVENALTGERVNVAVKTFPPEDPGAYNEATTDDIPQTWDPGVYLFRWEIRARNPTEESVAISGVESFLVLAG